MLGSAVQIMERWRLAKEEEVITEAPDAMGPLSKSMDKSFPSLGLISCCSSWLGHCF
jgi:hypothetical protein